MELALRITEFMGATQNPDILAECVSASRHVLAREYYKALMSARKIVEYEERVLNVASGLHSGDSEGLLPPIGIIDIDWAKRELLMQVCDVKGEVRISHRVALDTLRVG